MAIRLYTPTDVADHPRNFNGALVARHIALGSPFSKF
jgi:hypothetical protein